MSGPYRIAQHAHEVTLLVTNKTPVGTYRGPGRFEADFFRERLFDMAANDLGIDPRRIPPPQPDRGNGDALSAGDACVELDLATQTDSGDYRVTSIAASKSSAGPRKSPLQGKLVDGRHHGLAVGCYLEGGASGPSEDGAPRAGARRRGVGLCRLVRQSGRGSRRCSRQIAADALELPIDRISGVFHGSTDYVQRRLRRYQFALHRHGRLRHHRRRRQAA